MREQVQIALFPPGKEEHAVLVEGEAHEVADHSPHTRVGEARVVAHASPHFEVPPLHQPPQAASDKARARSVFPKHIRQLIPRPIVLAVCKVEAGAVPRMRGVWDVGVRPRNVLPAYARRVVPPAHSLGHSVDTRGSLIQTLQRVERDVQVELSRVVLASCGILGSRPVICVGEQGDSDAVELSDLVVVVRRRVQVVVCRIPCAVLMSERALAGTSFIVETLPGHRGRVLVAPLPVPHIEVEERRPNVVSLRVWCVPWLGDLCSICIDHRDLHRDDVFPVGVQYNFDRAMSVGRQLGVQRQLCHSVLGRPVREDVERMDTVLLPVAEGIVGCSTAELEVHVRVVTG
mmetsp:Transcript_3585/g.8596  ORF Transcript_3585/g.8596 Transcript_3585/m.8596 type:complete len:346 (+) Transcript_3585:258-1295(+)